MNSMLQTRLLAKACIITQTHKNTNCSNYTFLPTPKNDDDWIFNNRSIREETLRKKALLRHKRGKKFPN